MFNFINPLITSTAKTLKFTNCVVNDSQCQYSLSLVSYGKYEMLTECSPSLVSQDKIKAPDSFTRYT